MKYLPFFFLGGCLFLEHPENPPQCIIETHSFTVTRELKGYHVELYPGIFNAPTDE